MEYSSTDEIVSGDFQPDEKIGKLVQNLDDEKASVQWGEVHGFFLSDTPTFLQEVEKKTLWFGVSELRRGFSRFRINEKVEAVSYSGKFTVMVLFYRDFFSPSYAWIAKRDWHGRVVNVITSVQSLNKI